ncbi:hypothetical protein EDD86DRAFT_250418 [Gorgonomyces haynaldii]|nr:hypothetical protein EDD86DRAFT_250418 [Gorgonomyces haynaldii]
MEKLSQDLIACLLAGMIGFQIYALTVIVMRLPKQQKSTMALLMAFGILSSLMELIGLVTGIDELYSLLCKIVSCLSVLLVIYGQWHILHLVSSLSTFWTSRNITITQTLLMAVGLCCFWRVFDSPLSWIGDGALLLSLATPNTLSTHYMLHWIEKEVRSDPSFASLAAERRTNVKKVCRYLWILVILILATGLSLKQI